MPTYETLFITPPNLAEEDERATVEAMEQVVTAGGGTMVTSDRMGRRRLAYPIRKFEDGVYIRFLYDSGPDVAKELERRTRLSDNVLRNLTVRLELGWAQHAKEEAVREAQRRVEAEAAAVLAAAEAEKAKAEKEAADAENAALEAAEAAKAEAAGETGGADNAEAGGSEGAQDAPVEATPSEDAPVEATPSEDAPAEVEPKTEDS